MTTHPALFYRCVFDAGEAAICRALFSREGSARQDGAHQRHAGDFSPMSHSIRSRERVYRLLSTKAECLPAGPTIWCQTVKVKQASTSGQRVEASGRAP